MLCSPMPLGPFLIDENGRLTFRTTAVRSAFSFLWRGRRFKAELHGDVVDITATVARVPSTAGGPGTNGMGNLRQTAFDDLRSLSRVLPEGWKLRLAPDHRIQIDMEEPMEWPASASALLQPLVRVLLRLAPYLDLLEEIGLGMEASADPVQA